MSSAPKTGGSSATKSGPIKTMDCLHALANIIPAKCRIAKAADGRDALITLAYASGPDGAEGTTEVVMSLLNDAYIGTVRLWPMMKEVKDEIATLLKEEALAAKHKASEDKKAAARAEVEKRKADREAARKAKLEEQEAERKAKAAARDAARLEREAKAAAEKAEREAAKAKAAEAKKAADEAKKKADTAKAQKAANKLDAKGKLPGGAGNRAVAAVKASAGISKVKVS